MISPLDRNLSPGGFESRNVTQSMIKGASFLGAPPQAHLGGIVGIDIKKMTCDVKIYSSGVVISNVIVSSSSNSADQTMFSTPAIGQSCILITTSDLHNVAIPIGILNVDNSLPIYSGENIMKAKAGQLHSQDALGNQVLSVKSSVIEVQGADGVKTQISLGKHEKTTHSESISGIARTGNEHSSDIGSSPVIKGATIEKYYSSVETVSVNTPEYYLTSENNNSYIKHEEKIQCLLRATESMRNLNYMRTSLNELRLQMYNKSMSEGEYINAISSIKARIKTDFQIKKNLALTIEKGTVLNSNPETVRDISNISEEDIAKSIYGRDIVYRVKVVSPATGLKLGGIYFDDLGNCMIDCNNFLVNAKYDAGVYSDSDETGDYINP